MTLGSKNASTARFRTSPTAGRLGGSLLLRSLLIISTLAFARCEAGPHEVKVTSYLEQGGQMFPAENLVDRTYESWCEGEEGLGEGVEITLPNFDQGSDSAELIVRNGFGTLAYYRANGRVKDIEILHGKTKVRRTLRDTPFSQSIPLSGEIGAEIRLRILSVYPGSRFKDTCISELLISAESGGEIKAFETESWSWLKVKERELNEYLRFFSIAMSIKSESLGYPALLLLQPEGTIEPAMHGSQCPDSISGSWELMGNRLRVNYEIDRPNCSDFGLKSKPGLYKSTVSVSVQECAVYGYESVCSAKIGEKDDVIYIRRAGN